MKLLDTQGANVALYIRVAHSLRTRIYDGEWPPHAQLPTIPRLAQEYNVALVTIRQAFAMLTAEGLISSRRGKGTFVREDVRPIAHNASLRAAINDRIALPPNCAISVLSRRRINELPAKFAVPDAERYPDYVVVEKLHLHEGEPFCYMEVMVAGKIYDRIPPRADETQKMLKLILDQGRMRLARSRIEMALSFASESMAEMLRCLPLAPLVRIRTSRIDVTGKVVLCHEAYYRGDKFHYEVEEEGIELAKSNSLIIPDAPDPLPLKRRAEDPPAPSAPKRARKAASVRRSR
ncbi:MAG: GntR family transcriptional regulator [Burkholderiales bacterium]|nr:GntR family transcriptional regulator [Burkholderiales bacterium]